MAGRVLGSPDHDGIEQGHRPLGLQLVPAAEGDGDEGSGIAECGVQEKADGVAVLVSQDADVGRQDDEDYLHRQQS